MPRHNAVTSNGVEVLYQRVRDLHKRAVTYANEKSPSLPIYDLPTNPPGAAVEGQIVQDVNGKLWWFIDAEWRTC